MREELHRKSRAIITDNVNARSFLLWKTAFSFGNFEVRCSAKMCLKTDMDLAAISLKENLTFLVFFFVCGSIFGSFLNCVGMRIVNREDFVFSKSHCDVCGHALHPFDLIPILSYIFLKERCRYCGAKLSIAHPLTEFFLGVVFVLTYFHHQKLCAALFFDLSLFCVVFGLSLVDMRSYIIPDGFIAAGVLNWLIRGLFTGFAIDNVLSAALLSLSLFLLSSLMNKMNGNENFGGGDIKLIFMAVLYTGLIQGVWMLLLSSVFGLFGMLLSKKKKIPFGPYISFALFLVILYGDSFFALI